MNDNHSVDQSQQRWGLLAFLGIAGLVLLLGVCLVGLAVAVYANLSAAGPVVETGEEIVVITPYPRPLADGQGFGDPAAPVVVEVFTDYQCQACWRFSQETESLLAESAYVADGQVYYVIRQFPFLDDYIVSEKESDQAANAVLCAMEQGRFWDYHDMLLANQKEENQGAFSDARLQAFAEALGLDMAAFQECFAENRYQGEIDSDLALGSQYGVTGTPTVFVNGKTVTPGYLPSYGDLKKAIEEALKGGGSG